jgi:hypothetical protein
MIISSYKSLNRSRERLFAEAGVGNRLPLGKNTSTLNRTLPVEKDPMDVCRVCANPDREVE